MMRSNVNISLTRWAMIISLLVVALSAPRGVTGQDRGQGVKIKVEGGQSIDLYSGSYALVIGASNYQKWRRLPGVRSDADEVAAVLQKHGFKIEKLLDPTRESF